MGITYICFLSYSVYIRYSLSYTAYLVLPSIGPIAAQHAKDLTNVAIILELSNNVYSIT